MRRNFDEVIYELDGTPVRLVRDPKDVTIVPREGQPNELDSMTVMHAASQALLMSKADGANAKENVTRYHLAKKVYAGGVQDLKNEEVTLIRKAVGAVFGPLVIGQVDDWCDRDMPPVPSDLLPSVTE